jgi:uncharacterized protein (TIGR02611 family)
MSEQRHRRDVWGDDPEEIDASAVISELPVVEPTAERRWHEHPAFVPIKAVGRFIQRSGKRIAVSIAGFAVLLAGVVLLVLPGPGWLLIFIGLSILATQYVWAERLLRAARRKAEQAKDAVLRKKKPTDAPPTS